MRSMHTVKLAGPTDLSIYFLSFNFKIVDKIAFGQNYQTTTIRHIMKVETSHQYFKVNLTNRFRPNVVWVNLLHQK